MNEIYSKVSVASFAFLTLCFSQYASCLQAGHDKNTGSNLSLRETKISTGQSEQVDALILKLSDRNPVVRSKAAETLGEMHDEAAPAVKPLLRRLKDSDPGVRFFAAWALAYIGQEPKLCVPALLKAMDDRDHDVYMQATISLTAFPQEAQRIVPRMISGLGSSSKPRRYYCLTSIREFGKQAQAAIPLVIQATRDADMDIRLQAILALQGIGIYNSAVESALFERLTSDEWLLQNVAASALGAIGEASPAVLNVLAKKFEMPQDTDGTEAAIDFALLLDRDLTQKRLRLPEERRLILQQIEAAERNIRQHMGLFGDPQKRTEPALKQLERVKKDLDMKRGLTISKRIDSFYC